MSQTALERNRTALQQNLRQTTRKYNMIKKKEIYVMSVKRSKVTIKLTIQTSYPEMKS